MMLGWTKHMGSTMQMYFFLKKVLHLSTFSNKECKIKAKRLDEKWKEHLAKEAENEKKRT